VKNPQLRKISIQAAVASLFVMASLLLFATIPISLQAAEQPQTIYKEITWERLLPDDFSGKNFVIDSADNENLEAYLKKREHAPANLALQGKHVKLYGFIVPLERNENFSLTEFLLVPYFGACIHVPPPPQNQTVHVTLAQPAKGIKAMDTVFVYGEINVDKASSSVTGAAYKLYADKLEKDSIFSPFNLALAVGLTLLCGMSVCLGWVGPFTGIGINPAMASLGVAFAAGIMASLGTSALVVGISPQTLCLFFLGALFMAVGELLLCDRKAVPAGEKRRMGAGPVLAIALHNLPECILVFSTTVTNAGLGLVLGGAMLAHNIPLGVSLGLASRKNLQPGTARMYAILAGIAPPIAAISGYFFLKSLFSAETVLALFACAGGALCFTALTELIPFASQHGGKLRVFASFSTGVAILLLTVSFSYRG
jgi:zinc transporter ZupT